MRASPLFSCLAGVALVVCGTGESFDFAHRAGLYDASEPDSVTFQCADSTLGTGDTLTLLNGVEVSPTSPDPAGSPWFTSATVVRRIGKDTTRDILEGQDEWTYLLRVSNLESAVQTLGLGVVATPASFKTRAGRIESDVDADGLNERYSQCASYEGVHFSIWEGRAPYHDEPVVNFYYHVPYDLDPDCPGMDQRH